MGLLKSIARSIVRTGTGTTDGTPAFAGTRGSDIGGHEEARRALEVHRYQDALLAIEETSDRSETEGLLLRGRALLGLGREPEAARMLSVGSLCAVDDSHSLRALAWAAEWRGEVDVARHWWDRAIAINAGDGMAILGRARAALRAGDEASALRDAEAASRSPVAAVEGSRLVAAIHCGRQRFDDADATLRAAIAVFPDDVGLLEDLAVLLSLRHRNVEALTCLERVRAQTFDETRLAQVDVNLGIGMRRTGLDREGLELILRTLSRRAVLNGHLEAGTALLSFGEFEEGWRQYEHRWFVAPLAQHRAAFGIPQWNGQPLEGRTILVRCEQGFGDNFQFARFLPLLKAQGARVMLLPQFGLERIARRFPGVDQVIELGQPIPAADFYANLLSLPLGFGTTLETIPRDVPYLAPDAAYLQRWSARVRVDSRPIVGIIWAGRPQHALDKLRSLPFDVLAPLLAIKGLKFVSLQKGAAVERAEVVPDYVDWESIGPELDDFEDAAAVLANLDLLICVDTGPAHLAGAMGKDVWMLLQTPSDYRWLREREDTPWYPTMRLFRQATPGQWHAVVERVASELIRWLADRDASKPARRSPSPQPTTAVPIVVPSTLARAIDTRSGLVQYFPDDRMGCALEYYGEWLEPVLEMIRPHLAPGASVVEAGAGVGAHTLAIASAVGESGSVIAFEHDERLRSALEINLVVHSCRQVAVLRGGLGESPYVPGVRVSLDELCLDALTGLLIQERVDPVPVLSGAQRTLWRFRPWIAVVADHEDALHGARDALRDFGYDVWRRRIPWYSGRNFNRREDDRFGGREAILLHASPEEHGGAGMPPGVQRWT